MTNRHILAKAKMLQMLEDAGLPAPDETQDGTNSVRFLWHERKVAVVVELDEIETERYWCRYCDSPITLAEDGAWEDDKGACGCGRGEHEPGPPLRDVYGESPDTTWMNP